MSQKPTTIGGAINTGRLGGRVSTGSFAFHRKQATFSSRDTMAVINARYTDIIRKLRLASVEAIHEALKPAFEKSQIYVPVRYGTLKESGRIEVSEIGGGRIQGHILYGNASSRYAAIVHERTDLHHKVPTRAKFLQLAMEEEFDSMLAHLAVVYASRVGI